MPTCERDDDGLIHFAERLEVQEAGELPRLLTIKQAAARLQISDRSLWTLMRKGDVPSVRIGRSLRFDPADLVRYVQRCKSGGPQQ